MNLCIASPLFELFEKLKLAATATKARKTHRAESREQRSGGSKTPQVAVLTTPLARWAVHEGGS
jgi:hypothetical protein